MGSLNELKNKPSINADLLHILQHSLGLNQYGEGNQYRNHYVAGGDDIVKCRALAGMGYMFEFSGNQFTGGNPLFTVTAAGIDVVASQSPKPPKLTRSQKRYREYCKNADCFDSFRSFLRAGKKHNEH